MLQTAGGIAIVPEHPDSDGATIVPERPDVDGMQRQVFANRVHSLWCRVAGYSLAAYSVYSTHATIQINTCMGVSQRRRLSPRAGCSLSPAVINLHGSADFTSSQHIYKVRSFVGSELCLPSAGSTSLFFFIRRAAGQRSERYLNIKGTALLPVKLKPEDWDSALRGLSHVDVNV